MSRRGGSTMTMGFRERWAKKDDAGIALRRHAAEARDESGAVLVLALVFLVAVAMIVGALATWTSNDLNNSSQFKSARSLQFAVGGATNVAIQNIRYAPLLPNTLN